MRRTLPGDGELVLDRPLPFLVVHRARPGSPDEATPRLAAAEAAHLLWRGDPGAEELRALVRAIVQAGVERHGSFLLVEIWRGEGRAFRVRGPEEEAPATVRTMAEELNQLWDLDRTLSVEILPSEHRAPAQEKPLLTVSETYRQGALVLGLEVPPVYLQPGGAAFPLFFRRFREGISRALRRAAFEFARVQTDARVQDWRALGPREVDPIVWDADRALAEVGAAFDFLLLVSPVNEAEAWDRFRDSNFSEPPEFRYRLLPMDPEILKRRLYAIELEKVDDPALAFLLRDRREELDRKLSMLADRGTPDFLYGSIRLFHPVGDDLVAAARTILATVRPTAPVPPERAVDAVAFAAAAEQEFDAYRALDPAFAANAQVRPDVSGAMVSAGSLLIDERLQLDPRRVDALIQHEVGTHLLTWHNGSAQPLRQLARGLAGYDELQEGLGVLAEYLAGGVTPGRLRVIAARVLAARAVESGADFMETFRLLQQEHGIRPEKAFDVAGRVHHSGGFTRDAIYLRGVTRLLAYLAQGGDLLPLYSGKISLRQLDAVLELRDRGILRPPVLLPRVLERPDAQRRLEAARAGLDLVALVHPEGGTP
ncbi:MAG TPA: tyrosine/phenylalanine carboxypeptidase domain-containing protein [Longimicrobiales bacterium]